jgi:hypothetical protein
VRTALLLVTTLAMIAGGLWLLGTALSFLFIFAGAVLTTLGVYLLWVDFVAPLIGIKEKGRS